MVVELVDYQYVCPVLLAEMVAFHRSQEVVWHDQDEESHCHFYHLGSHCHHEKMVDVDVGMVDGKSELQLQELDSV